RENRLSSRPRRIARQRSPSHFGSKSHPRREKRSSVSVASMGAIHRGCDRSRSSVLTVAGSRLSGLWLARSPHPNGAAMRLMIVNGPNRNVVGVGEANIYGRTTLVAIQTCCEEFAKLAEVQLSFRQSNHEGVLVDLLQSARQEADAIIFNPAGYSFTSVAIFD